MLFAILVSCKGKDQVDQPIDNTTSPYGPNRITRTIMEDSKGTIYLATYEGVITYDGESFTNLTEKEGLDTCHAWSVLEDRKGGYWIATDDVGVYYYNGKTFKRFSTKDGLAFNRVLKIYEDTAGRIWFGTIDGMSRYDGLSFTNFTTEEGLPHNDIGCIVEDRTGKIWIGTRGGLCVIDEGEITKITNDGGRPFGGIVSVIEDREGNIWFGGGNGLWRYDGSSYKSITLEGVSCVYEDRQGNIWTNTNGWANKDLPNPHVWVLSRYDKESLVDEKPSATQVRTEKGMFFGIEEDKKGDLWVGTLEGVFRYDGETFDHFKDPGLKE